MRKRFIRKNVWQICLVATVCLFFFSIIGVLWSNSTAAEKEINTVHYYCLQEAVIDYKVHYISNELFSQGVLPSGMAYMTALTDYIVVNFEYNFFGDGEAQISGSYDGTASLVAMTAGEDKRLIWEKNFKILPEKHFYSSDDSLSITEEIKVPYAEYLAFTEQAKEETGYSPPNLNLIVNVNISSKVETADGVIVEEFAPQMVVPIKGDLFEVSGNFIEERESGITEAYTVIPASTQNARTVFSIIIPLSAIGLAVLSFFIVPEKAKSADQKLAKVLKRYRERIVMTANGIADIPHDAIKVYSFEELVKLADEVCRPILYPQPKYHEQGRHYFIVFTPESVYKYVISEDTPILNTSSNENEYDSKLNDVKSQ